MFVSVFAIGQIESPDFKFLISRNVYIIIIELESSSRMRGSTHATYSGILCGTYTRGSAGGFQIKYQYATHKEWHPEFKVAHES